MAWISTKERLPKPYQMVYVYGEYTPQGFSNPKAYLRDVFKPNEFIWCSTEWRGTAGITHWWDEAIQN